MIETKNKVKASGDVITASSVNIIQSGLDQIVSTWRLGSQGRALAVKGEYCRASLMNTWISWLKIYASRIGASSATNHIGNVQVGEPMLYSKIQNVYDSAMRVKNWCNRAECNRGECNHYESNSGESSNHECNNAEGSWG